MKHCDLNATPVVGRPRMGAARGRNPKRVPDQPGVVARPDERSTAPFHDGEKLPIHPDAGLERKPPEFPRTRAEVTQHERERRISADRVKRSACDGFCSVLY